MNEDAREQRDLELIKECLNNESSREQARFREKLFFGLQMLRMTTRNTTKIVEMLRENESKEVEPAMKRIRKQTWRRHVTDEIHSYVTLEKNLRITPGELEESGKILGKDLWVRAHSRETPLMI